ncbi:transposase [Glutamicibacter arilaitensis]|uniref:transposase n=1 Tax=Glutamicibacter arilaitensis TaxID=256701 RepID=UPI003FD164F1
MRKRSLFTEDQRVRLVELFEAGMGATAASNRLNVRYSATEKLYNRWRLHGRLCLMENPTKTAYSFETKKEVVQRYLAGETTMNLAVEFHISSNVLVQTWVRAWRQGGDEALMPKPKGRPKGAAKAEPLSEEEKLRRENKRLLAEVAYLKKLRDLRDQGRA